MIRNRKDVEEDEIPAGAELAAEFDSPKLAKIETAITLFALPKAFEGSAERHQRNALSSWSNLDGVSVVLAGDDAGICETAYEFDARHISGIRTNDNGTPLIGDLFNKVHAISNSPILVYCNCDVILLPSFIESLKRLSASKKLKNGFLAIGKRNDLKVESSIDFDDHNSFKQIAEMNHKNGVPASVCCKEYFAFTKNLFAEVPDFAVGRGNWDNWMVSHARKSNWPVVDLSQSTIAIHQEHDYTKQKDRLSCYVTGEEARENERLGGGKNVISGVAVDWKLTSSGLEKVSLPGLNLRFWADLPRFLRLVLNLMTGRR